MKMVEHRGNRVERGCLLNTDRIKAFGFKIIARNQNINFSRNDSNVTPFAASKISTVEYNNLAERQHSCQLD